MASIYKQRFTLYLFVLTVMFCQTSLAVLPVKGYWRDIFEEESLKEKVDSISAFVSRNGHLNSTQADSVVHKAYGFALESVDSLMVNYLEFRLNFDRQPLSDNEKDAVEFYYHPYFLVHTDPDADFLRISIGRTIGMIYLQKGEYLLAYKFLSEVKALAEKTGDKYIFNQMEEYIALIDFDFFGEKSEHFYRLKEILEFYEKNNNKRNYYAGLKNLVSLYIEFGEIDSAKYFMSRVPKTENTSLDYLMILGDFKVLEEDLDSATHFYELALVQCERQGLNRDYPDIMYQLGRIQNLKGQLAYAAKLLELSLASAVKVGDRRLITRIGELLRTIYHQEEDYKNLERVSDIVIDAYRQEKHLYLKSAVEGVDNNIELTEKKSELLASRILTIEKNKQIQEQELKLIRYLAACAFALVFAILMIFLNHQKKNRNKELAEKNREIQEQKEAIESTNKSLKNFAHIISHDFKQPLRQIVSFSQALIRTIDNPSEKQSQYEQFITTCGKDMVKMVDDILDFCSLGINHDKMDTVELDKLADKVIQYLSPLIAETNARIDIQPLPTVLGKETYLFQAFTNIITNGIKYVPDGRIPEITIKQALEGDSNSCDKTTILISDNGIGLEEAQIPLVFKPFQRVSNGMKVKGTGLGMATTKTVVEKMGGRIWIESEKDKGTSIYTELITNQPEFIDMEH